MPISVVITQNPSPDPAARAESEAELAALGFRPETVWLKFHGLPLPQAERELWRMRRPPAQFLVGSYWGMGPD